MKIGLLQVNPTVGAPSGNERLILHRGFRQRLGKHDGIIAGCGTRHAAPENRVSTSRSFDGAFQFWTIEVGCDLAFLLILIDRRVNFGLRRFGLNEAVNTQTALYADH